MSDTPKRCPKENCAAKTLHFHFVTNAGNPLYETDQPIEISAPRDCPALKEEVKPCRICGQSDINGHFSWCSAAPPPAATTEKIWCSACDCVHPPMQCPKPTTEKPGVWLHELRADCSPSLCDKTNGESVCPNGTPTVRYIPADEAEREIARLRAMNSFQRDLIESKEQALARRDALLREALSHVGTFSGLGQNIKQELGEEGK